MKRNIWCSTGQGVIHGWTEWEEDTDTPRWKRLLGLDHSGRVFHFESVELASALRAFELFLQSPEAFSVETADGVGIDFYPLKKGVEGIGLDIWFSNWDFDEAAVSNAAAGQLLEKIFSTASGEELAAFILGNAVG